MIWWSFRCTQKFITIIFLYVTFNDLLPFVSPQSMFSWTPIIKQGEIFITSSTKFAAPKRNFFSRDEPGASNKPSAISEGSMLSEMREDAYLYNRNTKEKEIKKYSFMWVYLDHKTDHFWAKASCRNGLNLKKI